MIKRLKEFLFGIEEVKVKSKLGNIELDVISEKSKSIPISVSSRRTEKGFNIADTTRAEPKVFSITVVDNSTDYLSNQKKLEEMATKGEPITFYFAGRDIYENIVIENIEEIDTNEQKYGFRYAISLKQIKTSEIKASDYKIDYKKAKSTGGKKIKKSGKSSELTKTESDLLKKKQEDDRTGLAKFADYIGGKNENNRG